jgi:hypothetical protein
MIIGGCSKIEVPTDYSTYLSVGSVIFFGDLSSISGIEHLAEVESVFQSPNGDISIGTTKVVTLFKNPASGDLQMIPYMMVSSIQRESSGKFKGNMVINISRLPFVGIVTEESILNSFKDYFSTVLIAKKL